MNFLPNEILKFIFDFTTYPDHVVQSLVCHNWHVFWLGIVIDVHSFARVAAQLGYRRLLKRMNFWTHHNQMISGAIAGDQVKILQWIIGRLQCFPSGLMSLAMDAGSLKVTEFLYNKYECNKHEKVQLNDVLVASANGHLEVLKWIQGRPDACPDLKSNWSSCCLEATRGGHIHILEWLLWSGKVKSEFIYQCAIGKGKWEVIQWLLLKDYRPRGRDVYICLASGDFNENVANWVCKWMSTDMLFNATMAHNLELVKWYHKKGLPIGPHALRYARNINSLEIAEYLGMILSSKN
jgi:hypothetical protein